MRKVDTIILHHSASPAYTTIDQIRIWHMARGFNDIGYHWVIYSDGRVLVGREEEIVGAHTKGHNMNSIGICVVGDFTKGTPSSEQLISLKWLIADIQTRVGNCAVRVHKDFAPTECPGCLMEELIRWK